MSDKAERGNSGLIKKEKKAQIIERITAVIIAIIRTANLANTFVTAALAAINVNNRSSKQFKLEDIEFFDSELDIEKDSTITNNKLWIQNIFIFIQQIKNIAAIKEEEIVRSNLSLYLQEAVII